MEQMKVNQQVVIGVGDKKVEVKAGSTLPTFITPQQLAALKKKGLLTTETKKEKGGKDGS